ncbi:MAG: hypothetical protein HFF22_06735 [Oscillospiraceae bacterium]|jgi:hypothetical protein|nr:hypothetical protein [Oscillospiraceae bacterium]
MEAKRRHERLDLPLVDVQNVQIDTSLSEKERIHSFVEQIRDPYRFKVGDVVVNVLYKGQETLNERFAEMMSLME